MFYTLLRNRTIHTLSLKLAACSKKYVYVRIMHNYILKKTHFSMEIAYNSLMKPPNCINRAFCVFLVSFSGIVQKYFFGDSYKADMFGFFPYYFSVFLIKGNIYYVNSSVKSVNTFRGKFHILVN